MVHKSALAFIFAPVVSSAIRRDGGSRLFFVHKNFIKISLSSERIFAIIYLYPYAISEVNLFRDCADTRMRSVDSGKREVSRMATSSITKNFVISGKEQVEAFADAIEAAANDKTPVHKVSARVLTDPKDIAKFMQKRKKANETR